MKKKIKIKEILNIFETYGDLNISVNTPYGYKKIEDCAVTQKNGDVFEIKTENNLSLKCSKNHRVKSKNGSFIEVKDIIPGNIVQTIDGNSKIISVSNLGFKKDLIDIQVKDVEQYYSNGIVSHNSTISVDLIMFLFFNKTTKSKTNAEVFNKFRDCDEVKVKGYIEIDGFDYIIERVLTRKMSKSNEFNVKSDLNFYKIINNELVNLTGEQRKETENIITSAIGTEEDFLLTILTTGYNLEELIDSKPTARGLILTRFLGLDLLKQKEEICKTMYNEWSKKLISNTYNITALTTENEINEKLIKTTEENIHILGEKLKAFESEQKELEDRRDLILGLRNNDIDQELLKINPDAIKNEIEKIIGEQNKIKTNIDSVVVKEPSEYYNEDDHDVIKREISDYNIQINTKSIQLNGKEQFIIDLENSSICPTCKQSIKDVDHTEEIEQLKKDILNLSDELIKLKEKKKTKEDEDSKYSLLKKEYESYEREKLRKERYQLEFDQKQLEIDNKNNKIIEFNRNKKKLEENKKIDEEVTILKVKIDSEKGNIRSTDNEISFSKNNVVNLKNKIKNNAELINKIKQEEEFGKTFKIYLLIYGKNGISKVIMKNMIPLLNSELHRLMMDSSYFTLEIIINDKNELEFLMIDNETRVVKSLNSGSGYEKTISSLAIRSVLTKISSLPKPNIVVMDEVFGKVADENLELIGEFFKKIKDYFEHILVISHNTLVRNWSDNLIMIKKEDNISSIEYKNVKFN